MSRPVHVDGIEVERVGDSVLVQLGGYTLLLAVGDASALGVALVKVSSSLAGDSLDEERPE